MAYFAYFDVWEAIDKICNENGYTLSVYIDDVTISADKISSQVIWSIKHEIHRAGLVYHKEKMFCNGKAEITGVIVDGDRISVPNRQRKKLKETADALRVVKRETDEKQLLDRLNGLRGQMAQVNAKA